MQTYSFFVRQLSAGIDYVQQQLRLPLVAQNERCAEFELTDNERLALCADNGLPVATCLPLSKRLLSALERNGSLFSHHFAVGVRRDCSLPISLRIPGHADVALCQECAAPEVVEPKPQSSSFWPGLSKVFVELLGHHRYRM